MVYIYIEERTRKHKLVTSSNHLMVGYTLVIVVVPYPSSPFVWFVFIPNLLFNVSQLV